MKFNSAFWRWFGDSKVVDDHGNPLVVYHGTEHPFSEFKGGHGRNNRRGVFFFSADPEYASSYCVPDWSMHHPNVIPVYLSLQNPYDPRIKANVRALTAYLRARPHLAKSVDRKIGGGIWELIRDADWAPLETSEVRKWLKANGFDGYYCAEGGSEVKTIAVFKPTQIKSVYNAGTWDPRDPDIRRNPIKLITKIRKADFAKKTDLLLRADLDQDSTTQLLIEMVLSLPKGCYRLHSRDYGTNIVDAIYEMYGWIPAMKINENLLRGMHALHPEKIYASFTLGLDAIEILKPRRHR
jgi:hypothetical protein